MNRDATYLWTAMVATKYNYIVSSHFESQDEML